MAAARKTRTVENGTEVRLRRNASYCDSEYETEKRRKFYTTSDDNPCHETADSLFSSSSGFSNYRGILNWCIVLLFLATGRVALENVMKYGILIDPIMWLSVFLKNPYSWPSFCLVISSNIFILMAFSIELFLSQRRISEKMGNYLYIANLFVEIVFPAVVVLYVHPSPFTSSPALAVYVVIFMKLISYKQVNCICRDRHNSPLQNKKRNRTTSHSFITNACIGNWKEADEDIQVYPDNINLKDLYYFVFAPTLCYELNFPRSSRIRKRFLIKRVVEMVFLYGLMLSLIQQWIIPAVNSALVPFQEQIFTQMVERLLKLAVPNHFIWLIFFYWLFHSCLNVVAELLRFGDRIFYKDWWNAETVQYFWRTWNIPVHKWASRHLYKPMINAGISRFRANIIVFLVSAFFHEYLVSVPLRMFRLWAFFGLLAQVPLAMLTPKYFSGKYGNMVVWMSLIIGQPIALLMYYHDYYIMNR